MEIVAIVDEYNRVTGSARREEMRRNKLLHRATYVAVFNAAGLLYVQERTLTKDVYPGYWDPVAGGVVLAGETYEESAERELAEEMGIRGVPLTTHGDFRFETVWGRVFSCVYDGPLVLQAEEVASVRLMTVDRIPGGERFTPDGIEAIRIYRSSDR